MFNSMNEQSNVEKFTNRKTNKTKDSQVVEIKQQFCLLQPAQVKTFFLIKQYLNNGMEFIKINKYLKTFLTFLVAKLLYNYLCPSVCPSGIRVRCYLKLLRQMVCNAPEQIDGRFLSTQYYQLYITVSPKKKYLFTFTSNSFRLIFIPVMNFFKGGGGEMGNLNSLQQKSLKYAEEDILIDFRKVQA